MDGSPIQVNTTMDLGKSTKEKLAVEARATPNDAEVLFEPALESGFWHLGTKGVHSLKITVKKGSRQKEYTASIEKLEEGTPTLKAITVAEERRSQIESNMTFIAAAGASSVEVSVESEPADTPKYFNSTKSEDGRFTLNLTDEETTLTITLGEAPKNSTYTLKVRKSVLPSSLVDMLIVSTLSTIKGQLTMVDGTELQKVLQGDRSVVVDVDGPNAMMNISSATKTWSSCKINGESVPVASSPDAASNVIFPIFIEKKSEEKEIAIEVEENGSLAFLVFKLKRSEKTIDLPIWQLLIDGINQANDLDVLTQLYDEANTSEPSFLASEGATVEVRCAENRIKNALINGTSCNVELKQDDDGNDVLACSSEIEGIKPQGKDVLVKVLPLDEATYHPTVWTFHLAYKPPQAIAVDYEFNGMNEYGLPEEFLNDLDDDKEPTLQVKGTVLNVRLICKAETKKIEINDGKYEGDEIVDIGDGTFGVKGRVRLDGTNETPITIKITPKDEDAYSAKVFKFKAKEDGSPERITPHLIEISKDKNLPKSTFLDKLSDGSKPLHVVHGNSADILAYINTYEYEFLCKEVKVNGDKVEVVPSDFANQWEITPKIPVTATSNSDVKIEFVGYDGISTGVTWEFQVKGGGDLPGLPREYIGVFLINRKGTTKDPLPDDFLIRLIDGTQPEHVFDGTKVELTVGVGLENLIKTVSFKVDSEQEVSVPVQANNGVYIAKHIFENIADGASHPVEIKVHPVEVAKYSALKLTFKLKWSGKKSSLPLVVGVDAVRRPNGWKGTIPAEKATLLVQARANVMKGVLIGVKGSEQQCNIKSFTGSDGRKRWQADKEVNLLVNDEVVEQTFAIKVVPLDENEYETATYEYTLKGTKVPKNNAEFVWTGDQGSVPYLRHDIEWVDNAIAVQFSDMYGVKSDTITVKTVSPRATVKYQIIDPLTSKPLEGHSEGEMTNDASNKGTHLAKIVMLANLPTHLRLWVVAEDGSTKNNQKGLIGLSFNTAQLAWSYANESEGKNFKNNAYDVIEINENEVSGDKKIYLAFSIYAEKYGYSVLNDNLPSYQTPFEKLDTLGQDFQSYKSCVDVSSLIDKSQNELEAELKVIKNSTLCFTYKVKIKLKS